MVFHTKIPHSFVKDSRFLFFLIIILHATKWFKSLVLSYNKEDIGKFKGSWFLTSDGQIFGHLNSGVDTEFLYKRLIKNVPTIVAEISMSLDDQWQSTCAICKYYFFQFVNKN